MPTSPAHACRNLGCPGLVRGGVCSECGKAPAAIGAVLYDRARGSSSARGYDRHWSRVRLAHLRSEPLCRICASYGNVTAAELVDHIQPINDGGAVLDDANLQSLCGRCHARKTADDLAKRAGGG